MKFIRDLIAEFKRAYQEDCPVCGYYCVGKGGNGCIDKPSLISREEQT